MKHELNWTAAALVAWFGGASYQKKPAICGITSLISIFTNLLQLLTDSVKGHNSSYGYIQRNYWMPKWLYSPDQNWGWLPGCGCWTSSWTSIGAAWSALNGGGSEDWLPDSVLKVLSWAAASWPWVGFDREGMGMVRCTLAGGAPASESASGFSSSIISGISTASWWKQGESKDGIIS